VRRETLIASLDRLVEDMQALELDATAYQQLLITATGEVTADIFETKVAIGLVEDWLDRARKWTRDHGPELIFKILLFFMILGIAWVVSRIARLGLILRLIFRLTRTKPSKLLQDVVIPTIC
jgi:small conductance mechanosensitive channel